MYGLGSTITVDEEQFQQQHAQIELVGSGAIQDTSRGSIAPASATAQAGQSQGQDTDDADYPTQGPPATKASAGIVDFVKKNWLLLGVGWYALWVLTAKEGKAPRKPRRKRPARRRK